MASKTTPSISDLEDKHVEAAFMAHVLKMTQEQIAPVFSVQQSTVSNWLNKKIEPLGYEQVIRARLSEEAQKQLTKAHSNNERHRSLLLEAFVPKSLRERLREVRVFPSGEAGGTSEAEYLKRLSEFGAKAAPYFRDEVLAKSRCMGLGWGRTIEHLIKGLRGLTPPKRPEGDEIAFVPIVGNPVMVTANPKHSASTHVSSLNELMNPASTDFISLAGQPANIYPDSTGCVLHWVRTTKGYVEVFGQYDKNGNLTREGAIHRLDTLLCAIGVVAPGFSKDPWLQDTVHSPQVNEAALARDAVGNIAGVYLPKGGKTTHMLDVVNRHWAGSKMEHLKCCALQASADRPGVVVLAMDRRKVDVVIECLRQGLVNRLILGHDLFTALEQRAAHLKSQKPSKPVVTMNQPPAPRPKVSDSP